MSVKRFMLNVIFVVFIVHNACVNGYKTRKYRSLKFVNQQQQQPKQYNGQIQQKITETEHIQEVEVPKQIQKIQEVNVEDVPVVQQVTQEGGQQQRIQQQDEEDDIEELIKQEDIEEEKVMNQIVKEEEPPMVMQVEQQPIVEKEESELPMLEQTESEESIQEPVVFQQDVGGEFPVIPENNVQQPVTVQEPVTVQQPTTVQQQVTVQQPTTMQQPVTVQQPIITQEPVTVQQPITVQEPVTVQQQSIEETPIPLPEEEEEKNETELVKLNEEISSIISALSTLSSKVDKEAIDTNPTSKFLESFSTSYYSLMDSISSKTSNTNTKLEKLTKLLSQSIISQLSSQIFIINNAIILLEGKQKQLQEDITKSPSLQTELDANTKRLEEYKLEKEHLENSLNSIQTLINEHIIEGDEHESTSLEPTEEMNQQIALLELLKNQLTSLYHKHEISSN